MKLAKVIWHLGKYCDFPAVFDNMALQFECRINKNALFQTVFFAILHTGKAEISYFFQFSNTI